MFRLDRSLVRLIVLSMAHQVSKEKIGGVAIADPHYMIETNFRSPQGQKFMAGHLEELLLQHKWKDFILFPYFQVIPYAIINSDPLSDSYHSFLTFCLNCFAQRQVLRTHRSLPAIFASHIFRLGERRQAERLHRNQEGFG